MTAASVWSSRALTPDEELERVRIRIEDGRIAEVCSGEPQAPGDTVYPDGVLVPGLVDLQVNGGNGAAYLSEDPEERRRATAYHLRSGTTSLLATLVTAPFEQLEVALREIAGEVSPEGPILGIHLEGPFLSAEKRGAHARQHLRDPDSGAVERLLGAAGRGLRIVTLAPERPGALEAVESISSAGVIVSAGHSCATLKELRDAIDRGLSFMTHVGNTGDWPSRPLDPARGFRVSEPGMVGTFLIESRLRGSLILDGLHLHPELARAIVRLRGVRNVALVSDATHAAGLPPGRYARGGLDTLVQPGGYATAGTGLAGSVVPLVETVRVAVREAGLSLQEAIRMATRTPAEVIGVQERKGALAAGADADFLLLEPDLGLRAVYRRGELVAGRAEPAL
jgi:N-acetylglucosamine-6-phosphate deacetylase